MLGLFGTLNLATRALQTQQVGVQVAGHNLANVNNPAHARQRVALQTSPTLPTALGPQGTGADVAALVQIRSHLLDRQVQDELSVGGYWTAQQSALQYAQAALGEYVGQTGNATDAAAGRASGLAEALDGLFNAFQSVATNPTSMADRQVLLHRAQTLASRFNQTASRLDDLRASLDASLVSDVASANELLDTVATLNAQIVAAELARPGAANDLRDLRQQKLEELAQRVHIETSQNTDGSVNVSVAGTVLVSGRDVLDRMEVYDAGAGQKLVRAAGSGQPLLLTGGSIQGTIETRDGALTTLRASLDTLAGRLVTQVNAIHRSGYALTGETGADFFTGTDAASLGVNAALLNDPARVQAAGARGMAGDNTVALALARLADTPLADLGHQTFAGAYGQTVAGLGAALQTANNQLADHQAVNSLLLQQREAVSGVSVDEEMTDLIRFQKAYEASAKLVVTVDEMLETVIGMKR